MKRQSRKGGVEREKEEMGHRGNVAKLNAPRRKEASGQGAENEPFRPGVRGVQFGEGRARAASAK